MTSDSRRAQLVLVVFAAFIALLAWTTTLRSGWTADDRTYLEMTAGVVRTGVPCTDNGPAAEHPVLRARWNVPRNGRLCGAYAPLFPYVAAPAWMLGGAGGVIRFNVLLLGVAGLLAAAFARRATGEPGVGALAGVVTVFATPLPLMAFVASPYSLLVVLTTAMATLAADSMDAAERPRALRGAALAGLFGGLAVITHMIVVPLLAAVGAASLLAPRLGVGAVTERPWRVGVERATAVVVGAMIPFGSLIALNARRYGAVTAFSVGCPWHTCVEPGRATIGGVLSYALPLLVWLVTTAAASFALRRDPRRSAGAVAVACLALVLVSALRERAAHMATLLWGFLIDVSPFSMEGYFRTPDGLGLFSGFGVVKSLLQCSPALAVAALVPWSSLRQRPALFLAAALPLAHYLALSLRGWGLLRDEWGEPYLHFRYNNLVLPFLVSLALAAARPLPRTRAVALAGLLVAGSAFAWLSQFDDDFAFSRRALLLRGTLLLAALTAALVVAARRRAALATPAAYAFSAALGLGAAISLGADTPSFLRLRGQGDALLEIVAGSTPRRFALVGAPSAIDVVLPLASSRDIRYADTSEATSPNDVPAVFNLWRREGRPTFFLAPGPAPAQAHWPGVVLVPVQPLVGLYELRALPRETAP